MDQMYAYENTMLRKAATSMRLHLLPCGRVKYNCTTRRCQGKCVALVEQKTYR